MLKSSHWNFSIRDRSLDKSPIERTESRVVPEHFREVVVVEYLPAAKLTGCGAGQKLAYFYYEKESGQRPAAKLLTKGEARRIAAKDTTGCSVGRPDHERAHPDGHAVREVRTALEHQVVSPGWFVCEAKDTKHHV